MRNPESEAALLLSAPARGVAGASSLARIPRRAAVLISRDGQRARRGTRGSRPADRTLSRFNNGGDKHSPLEGVAHMVSIAVLVARAFTRHAVDACTHAAAGILVLRRRSFRVPFCTLESGASE